MSAGDLIPAVERARPGLAAPDRMF